MKILNVQLKHIHGGNPQISLDYTRALRAAGNEVISLLNPQDPFINKHLKAGAAVIKSRQIGKFGSYDLGTIVYFKLVLRKVNPDIIVVHEGRSAALFKRAAGNNYLVVDVNHGRSPKQSVNTDATIVTNSAQFKKNKEFLGEDALIFKVPNPVNLEGTKPPVFPKKWHKTPVIGTVGRLVDDKAYDIFIEALAILDKKGINFQAQMAGEGEERKKLASLIRKYDLDDKVKLLGWLSDPDSFYEDIDIFCFPSRKEEFGLVLLEAFKHGLPAVVSDAEGPFDVVTDGEDAIMVPKDDIEALANGLESLLKDKSKADRLANAGYRKLLSHYDMPIIARQLQMVLEHIVNAKKGEAA